MSKVEDFKPVVIYVYCDYIEAEKNKILFELRALHELKPKFEELGLEFTTETFRDFCKGGKKSLADALRLIEDELSKVSPVFRKGSEANYRNMLIDPLSTLIYEFKNACSYIGDPEWISVDNWVFSITEKGQAEIEQKHTIVARTQDQLDIWNELAELCEKIKALENKVRPFGLHLFEDPALIRPNLDPIPAGIPECRKDGLFVRK